MRFRGKETEFTAESKCVSFPVCNVTNANYLISPGGADVKGRIVKTFEKPTERKIINPTHGALKTFNSDFCFRIIKSSEL